MRIGHGYDVHKFCPGDGFVLGGKFISCDKAIIAHSDGDVLIHAICDALLGAAGLGDIGKHFPDSNDKFKGVDSRSLLRTVIDLIRQRNLSISNLDTTCVAQSPKLSPYIDVMKQTLSDDLAIATDRINIKATTTEGLGFTGREEGIAVHAVVILTED
ncbi:MAG: 2-C-methyl-D-erythritol 2,4-cyclodiphosphate synthase [Gammaproteobacteria bacterium]